MRKRIGLLVLILYLILNLAGVGYAVDKGSVTIVTKAWPPYIMKNEKGNPTGFDYEISKAVFDRMGVELKFKFYPWKRSIKLAQLGRVDGILDISLKDSRQEFMYFPKEHLSMSSSVLFYKKNSFNAKEQFETNDEGFILLEELKGYTIGYTLGYNYGFYFEESNLFEKQQAESDRLNFKKLLANRIDLFLINKNNGLYKAKKMGISNQISYIEEKFSGGPVYLAFSKKSVDKKLVRKFSNELKRFKKTKQYDKIRAKYGQ